MNLSSKILNAFKESNKKLLSNRELQQASGLDVKQVSNGLTHLIKVEYAYKQKCYDGLRYGITSKGANGDIKHRKRNKPKQIDALSAIGVLIQRNRELQAKINENKEQINRLLIKTWENDDET